MNSLALITGIPRSGTTLVTKLLNCIPDVVALNEPMPVMQIAGKSDYELYHWIDSNVESYRSGLIRDGRVMTNHVNQNFVDNSFSESINSRGLRPSLLTLGLLDVKKNLTDQFLLAIKHNGAFTAVAHHLVHQYRCFAVIRNPLPVLLSWQTVDIPLNRGRMPVAEAIDTELHRNLNRLTDHLDRQIFILNWFFERYYQFFSEKNIIRYEDLVKEGSTYLTKITPGACLSSGQLSSRNTSSLYTRELVPEITARLKNTGGHFTHFYSISEIESVLSES